MKGRADCSASTTFEVHDLLRAGPTEHARMRAAMESGRDDIESAGPGPVDEIACQSRLIAIGQRIDHAGFLG